MHQCRYWTYFAFERTEGLPTQILASESGFPVYTGLQANIYSFDVDIKNAYLPFLDVWKCLPFLDVYVERIDVGLETSVYRKPTFTGQYLRWESFSPLKRKISPISTLVHRALMICTKRILNERNRTDQEDITGQWLS